MDGSMDHFTSLRAVLKPGGRRSRMGRSKSWPKRRALPLTGFLKIMLKVREYWSVVWDGWVKMGWVVGEVSG